MSGRNGNNLEFFFKQQVFLNSTRASGEKEENAESKLFALVLSLFLRGKLTRVTLK